MRAAADDHDVVGVLELRRGAPHAPGAEQVTHAAATSSRPSASAPIGPPPRLAGGVGDHGPHVAAERGAEQHQPAVLGLAQDRARRARDRAGPEAVHRGDPRAQVERGEAREDLAGRAARRSSARRIGRGRGPTARRRLELLAQLGGRAPARTGRARARARSGTTSAVVAAGVRRAELAGRARRCSSSLPSCERSAKPTVSQRCAPASPSKPTAHVPAVALLEPRARGERLALHRAARDRARRGRQERRGSRAQHLALGVVERRGRRPRPAKRLPSSEIVTRRAVLGERRRHPGHPDHPAELRRVARARDLADRALAVGEHRPRPRSARGRCCSVKPDQRGLELARPAARSSAHLPMKSCSLSSLTIQGIAAPNGVDSESVSWPISMCIFCRRSSRWGSRPNGFMPCSRAGLHERVPEVLAVRGRAVDLVAHLAHEADPQDQAGHARHLGLLAVEVGERLGRAVEVGELAHDLPRARARRG